MKKIYFLLIAIGFFTTTNAQINFPDANFKAKLLSSHSQNSVARDERFQSIKIDLNNDNQLQLDEASRVYYLDVNNSNISSLVGISNFINLIDLNCESNKLTTLDLSELTKLETLFCGHNQLASINLKGLVNLKNLSCPYNLINNLDLKDSSNLISLVCENNKLQDLVLNHLSKLEYLTCGFNQLTSLNLEGLSSLIYLTCHKNKLTKLNIDGLSNLTLIDCGGNLLNSLYLNNLANLLTLDCGYNDLKNLNLNNFNKLSNLECGYNQLTSLDVTSLINLEYFGCSNNQLYNLQVSNLKKLYSLSCIANNLSELNLYGLTNLNTLNCSNNQLSSLDLQGLTKISFLWCSYNKLTKLDVSNLPLLNFLNCIVNQISFLNLKNGPTIINPLEFINNPELQYICIDEHEINNVQKLLNLYVYSNCQVNSYCSFAPGGTFYTIQGNQKLDSNNNGCDANDIIMPNLKYIITNGTITGGFVSNSTGNYSIPVFDGTHTITPKLENPTYYTVSPSTVNVTFPTQTSPFIQNFCITSNGVRPDLEVTLLQLQPARPGFDAKYKLVYKNKGNTIQSGAVNLSFNDAVLDLVVANPLATNQTMNNLSWSFTNLQPFETREITFTMNVNSPQESPAVINGDILSFTSTITSVAVDETPADNTFTFNQTVVGSYDPNDKTCLKGSVITPALIGQYVHYMIRFENKGTFAATNVVVKDMIDLSKFDISTLIPTSASHSYVTNITAGNKVEFVFQNINLPFDDANNDGYIAFKIKTKPTLVVNDSFTNEANIYFDYNFPILTNKAISTFKTLGTQDFDFAGYFTLYPNPAKTELNISAKETINVQSISVYNTLGQLVLVVTNADKVSKIDVSSLTAGNYFIQIKTDKGTSNTRFIKE